ncbi:putative ead/Ea22-like family protein [Glutamicibacter phage BIM BV-113]|nr:putative ead/Ea22-like family protein [Glutamicibacter phage BIM BV-113]
MLLDYAPMEQRAKDAKFIATFDPPTVLALLTQLEQAEAQVARVRELASEFDKHEYPRGMHRFAVAKRIRRALDGESI